MAAILKDGRPLEIRTWNFGNLERFVASSYWPSHYRNHSWRIYDGFTFFGPDAAVNLRMHDPDNQYRVNPLLSPLERQEWTLPKTSYHRALVASLDGQPVGILLCEWLKCYNPYWSYHLNYIDVREDTKNLGIGTSLLRKLDRSRFLKRKILRVGWATEEGRKHIMPVVERELRAREYALVHDGHFGDTPLAPGIYRKTSEKEFVARIARLLS